MTVSSMKHPTLSVIITVYIPSHNDNILLLVDPVFHKYEIGPYELDELAIMKPSQFPGVF